MDESYEESVDEMIEEDVYVGSEGDVDVADDGIVTDELLDVDDAGADDYAAEAGGSEAGMENGGDSAAAKVKDGEQEEAQDVDSGERTSHKRSRSHSKSPPEKDDFDDEELDSDVDETAEKADNEADPEDEEYDMLNMPPQHVVVNQVGQLKQERRVMAHSLSLAEFNDVTMQELLSREACEELKIHFVRPKGRPHEWSGFVVMHFMSSQAAKQASDDMKSIREDLKISTEDGAAFPRSVVETWAKEEKGQKRWTDTLLYVKNIGEDVTEDQLKEVFADAEDIVIPKADSRRKDDKKTKTAYVVYRTGELAVAAAHDYAERSVELDGHRLKIYKYHAPMETRPTSYLRLRERRVVLKYLAKLTEKIDSCTAEELTVPEWCTKRRKLCESLIERDDKFRQSAGLSTPSLDDIRAMKRVKLVTGVNRKSLLTRLGVLERRRPTYGRRDGGDRGGGYDRRKSGGGYRSPLKPTRSLLGTPPSLLSMPTGAMPLSLMMQQNNLALMSGLMNQGGMNWGAMRGGGDMYRGGGGGRSFEPSNKVLRLDSAGNLRPDYGSRRPNARDDRSRSSYGVRSDRR